MEPTPLFWRELKTSLGHAIRPSIKSTTIFPVFPHTSSLSTVCWTLPPCREWGCLLSPTLKSCVKPDQGRKNLIPSRDAGIARQDWGQQWRIRMSGDTWWWPWVRKIVILSGKEILKNIRVPVIQTYQNESLTARILGPTLRADWWKLLSEAPAPIYSWVSPCLRW